MNIYVGNLSYQAGEEELRQTFSPFGQVASANIIKDRATGESRGFGFVEMPNKAEGTAAIEGLNGKDFQGRRLVVNEARPRTERRDGPRPDRGFGDRGGDRGGFGGRERRERSW